MTFGPLLQRPWHPVILKSTFASRPCFLISAAKAVPTAAESRPSQAAPPHTAMQDLAGSRPARIPALSFSSSAAVCSLSMIHSYRFLLVLFQYVGRLFRRHPAIVLAVDDQFGPDAAASQATARLQRELRLGVGLAALETGDFLHLRHQLGAAAQVAGHAGAHVHLVAPLGRQAEGLIEAGDLHDRARQPVVRMLDLRQRVDQRAGPTLVFFDDAVDLLFTHVVVSPCST